MFPVKTLHFNDVIQIEDTFNVNTFLDRLSREESKHRVKDLNSVFIKHMFSWTENPSDSEISPEYMERMHETGKILLNLSNKIQETRQLQDGRSASFTNFASRMKNLIDLINAEKFDFEDLHAWRMGSKMETIFRDRWKILSEEFSKLKISLNNRIRQSKKVSGKIYTVGEIQEEVDEMQKRMIKMQEDSISAIRDLELEPYYKQRLILQLSDQIRNESRDLKLVLKDLFHEYEHEIRRKTGKFSNTALKKKIEELIDNEKTIENISEKDILQNFENFWRAVIESAEILEFRKNMKITQNEQIIKYRHDMKKAFETCFENDQVDIVAKQEFTDLKSIENWKFNEGEFRKIKIEDGKYFHKDILQRLMSYLPGSAKNHKGIMPQLLNQIKGLINENSYTKKNVAGFVDNKVIHELCSEFNQMLWLTLKLFKLEKCATPLFQVHVVGFACFKLLLPRLQQNLKFYQESKDPVNELNKKKEYFKNLYRSKLQGAKQSFFWEQRLSETMLEIIQEIFLNPIGSQETYDLMYKFIQKSGTNRNRSDVFLFELELNLDYNLPRKRFTYENIH